jgi:tetratricopeptide (TPR) repeat protein
MRATTPTLRCLPLLLLIAAAIPAGAQEWVGRGRARGRVEDENGKPVRGAVVVLRPGQVTIDTQNLGAGPEPVVVDDRGNWAILGLAGGTWTALVSREGYRTATGNLLVHEFESRPPIETVLQSIPKEVLEAQAAAAAMGELQGLVDEGNKALTENKPAEARAAYEQVLAKLPVEHQPPILRGVARTYFLQEQVDQAVSILDKALAIVPDDPETLRLVVDMLVAAGRDKDAEPYIAKLPSGSSMDPTTLLNMGIKRYNEGKLDEALAQFDRVVKEHPEMGAPYYYRGLARLGLGQSAEAKADFQKFVELEPNHPKVAEAQEFIKSM